MIYSGSINDYQLLLKWISDKCIPLVREITFENAEVCLVDKKKTDKKGCLFETEGKNIWCLCTESVGIW